MCNSELKDILQEVFTKAYQIGKENTLEGLHICPELLFSTFLESENTCEKVKLLVNNSYHAIQNSHH